MYVNVEVPEATCVLYVHIFTELEVYIYVQIVRKKKFGKNLFVFFNFILMFFIYGITEVRMFLLCCGL